MQLYYDDESSFSLTSALPYAWQKKGRTIELPATRGKRMNVAALINRQGNVFYHQQEENITSKNVITLLDEVGRQIKQKTIVVVDNAPTHRLLRKSKRMARAGFVYLLLARLFS